MTTDITEATAADPRAGHVPPRRPPLDAWALDVADELVIVGGLDPDAATWWVRDRTGAEWAVKATRRDCRFGLALAAAVASTAASSTPGGIAPGVVAPLATGAGDLWLEHDGRLVSVSPWIDGDDAAEDGRGLTSTQWTELGTTIRRIHDQAPPRGLPPLRQGIKRTGRRARVMLRELDRVVADVPDGAARGDDVVRELWRSNRPRLADLEQVALRLKADRRPAERVSCHGDPHLGNVVVDSAGRPWLIDLDEATIAPREVDLVLVELGVLPGLPIEPGHRSAFRDGYGDVALDDERIVRFGCIRALEDVTATVAAVLGAHSPQDHSSLVDLLGPHGLVELVEQRIASASIRDS